MARIRTVKPAFFRHRKLYLAEIESGLPLRVAFAALWTCADREGRFKWEPEELKLDCLPYDDVEFPRVLHALFTRGFIVKYASGSREYGVIPSFKDHQIVNNREADSLLPVPPDNLDELIDSACEVDACSTRDPRDTILHERNRKGREQEGKGKGTDRGTRDTRPDEDFESFWESYPKREGANPKEPAAKLFRAAVKAGTPASDIIAGAKTCAVVEVKNIGTPYIPQAVKWLRDKRWRDYAQHDAKIAEAEEALAKMYYAKPDSEQLEAWDKHSMATRSRLMPRDKNFGWYVPSEWPPGYEPRTREATVQAPPIHINSMQ